MSSKILSRYIRQFVILGLLSTTPVTFASLKILVVTNEFPKFIQPFILDQITGLIDRGHDVWILADKSVEDIVHPNVTKYNLPSRTFYKTLPPDKQEFDIIYCHFGPNGCWGQKLREQGVTGKLVTVFHGADISQVPQRNPHKKSKVKQLGEFEIPCYKPTMYDELFDKADLIIAVSDYFKQKLIKLGCSPHKIIVHHCGVNCSIFTSKNPTKPANSVRIVTTGRLVEKKGHEYAIKAVASLIKKYPLEYIIIGDGPLRESLQKLINKQGASESIHIVGWKSHTEVRDILDSSHIFLLPSVVAKSKEYLGDEEGIPVSIMEGMCMQLPVVSTYHAGIPELVKDNVSGYLVPERDHKKLAEKLEQLITKPKLRVAFGRAGRLTVEQDYNTEKQNNALVDIFRKLLNS